jgi:hypothetical protein
MFKQKQVQTGFNYSLNYIIIQFNTTKKEFEYSSNSSNEAKSAKDIGPSLQIKLCSNGINPNQTATSIANMK